MMRSIVAALLILVLAAATLFGCGYFVERRARELSAVVARNIYGTWDDDAMQANATADLRVKMKRNSEVSKKLFNLGREKLGSLQTLGTVAGGAGIRWGAEEPNRGLFGHYEFKAQFQGGDAKLEIELQWEHGGWRVAGTRFNAIANYGNTER
jgi:hypothetical protein